MEGCCADLSLEEKVYCFKKRICSYHMRAEVIVQPSDPYQQWRFCFQVGVRRRPVGEVSTHLGRMTVMAVPAREKESALPPLPAHLHCRLKPHPGA